MPPNKKPVTYVYIDSFNLYYGLLNRNKNGMKWLNLMSWLSKLLPSSDIQKIKFFTARVSGKNDPTKPVRQDIYLRALKTIKNIEIIEGSFLFKNVKTRLSEDVYITAKVAEEKGTDVNLAVHLLNDAHNKKFDNAVIVSNDSDFAEVVKIVTNELVLPVGIINPCERFSKELTANASFKIMAREAPIFASQFPATLNDSVGTITKPLKW